MKETTQMIHDKRPLSPHLSIYKLQLTSGLSILHRITGAYLYLGLITLSWLIAGLVYYPISTKEFINILYSNNITAILLKLAIFAWSFSLFYHLLNGIRHLFWDAGKGFELRTSYISGRIVIISAFLLTIITWGLV